MSQKELNKYFTNECIIKGINSNGKAKSIFFLEKLEEELNTLKQKNNNKNINKHSKSLSPVEENSKAKIERLLRKSKLIKIDRVQRMTSKINQTKSEISQIENLIKNVDSNNSNINKEGENKNVKVNNNNYTQSYELNCSSILPTVISQSKGTDRTHYTKNDLCFQKSLHNSKKEYKKKRSSSMLEGDIMAIDLNCDGNKEKRKNVEEKYGKIKRKGVIIPKKNIIKNFSTITSISHKSENNNYINYSSRSLKENLDKMTKKIDCYQFKKNFMRLYNKNIPEKVENQISNANVLDRKINSFKYELINSLIKAKEKEKENQEHN